jgi:Methyltransferase domain
MMSFVSRIFKKFERPASLYSAKLADATLLITHAEVSVRHGTGALLKNIFRDEKELVIVHSQDFFGSNEIGSRSFRVQHGSAPFEKVVARIKEVLQGIAVRRILCVPFYQDDVLTALAAANLSGAPIALYVMDDQNIHVREISDRLMTDLVNQAQVCFAISQPLRTIYQEKFKRSFWFVPPVVSPDLIASSPPSHSAGDPPKGVLIGNVWSQDVLNDLRKLIQESGLIIDWFGNAGKPFIELAPEKLLSEGLRLRSVLPDEELVDELRQADFAIVPSGRLSGETSHDWLARASLPSRIIYLTVTANIPIIVVGHPDTAAAKFVTKLGLGVCCDYESSAFAQAVAEVTADTTLDRIRRRANSLAPSFSSEGMATWLWRSLELSKPADLRYENLINVNPEEDARRTVNSMIRSAKTSELDSAWSEYLSWLTFAVPGMLVRGNVDAIAFALQHLPSDAPLLEIGSFCGLSTCVISYFKEKLGLANSFYTCDLWSFEGQKLGQLLADSRTLTHNEYKNFVRESFLRNVRTFCRPNIPHTIEADSDAFFEQWSSEQNLMDVFGAPVKLGGPISFCFIDGNHSYAFARRDFENTDRFLVPKGFILFDDSADGSEWEVCQVVKEVLASGSYDLVSKKPNYLLQKK